MFKHHMAAVLVAGLSLALAPSALAAGGSSIGGAPDVTYDQTEFGNAPVDGETASFGCLISWWNLPVVAGDEVTIDLAGQTEGDGFTLDVFPIGTNDYNVASQDRFTYANGDKLELVFTAPATGTMPVGVLTCDSVGTYHFNAHVQHGLVATLTKLGTSGHVSRFSADAATPEGTPVTDPEMLLDVYVKTRSNGSWHVTKTVRPGDFQIRWSRSSRGQYRWVRVRAHAPGYHTATSRTVRVKA